ncbi:MAG TPA: FecR family protein [Chthoniobacterales bacterium]|nr:FecR family protein [Chthoniobacterales bacterium]
MANLRTILFVLFAAGALITFSFSQTPAPEPEGHVTAIFHDVQLLPEQADARPAAINDKVDDGTALRTGGDSRSELTFADLTITRLGENTIFSFNRAGRSIRLDSGSILLYARKNSGTAEILTKAVSVGITGTTVIFESKPAGYDRLIVLEGDARFSLNDYPDQSTEVRAGQLLNVKAGAKKLPKLGRVDLRRIMRTHPLIKNFPPLPSLDLILAPIPNQNRNVRASQPPVGGKGPSGGRTPIYVPNPTGPPPPPPPRPCWCCINGQVVQTTEADCRQRDGECYGSRKEALKNCRGVRPTPTPTPYHPPTPTPHPTATATPQPTPKPTPRPTVSRPGYPIKPPKPTPTPKKKYPPKRPPVRPTPTPKPTPPTIY